MRPPSAASRAAAEALEAAGHNACGRPSVHHLFACADRGDPDAPRHDPPWDSSSARLVLFAEFLGTGLLVTVVVGSGIAATSLTPDDVGSPAALQLHCNGPRATVLILMSGAHLRPWARHFDWWLGRRPAHRDVAGYAGRAELQVPSRCSWRRVMFERRRVLHQSPQRLAPLGRRGRHRRVWLALIFALALAQGRSAWAAPAVGAYIGAAYWFTSSTNWPSVECSRRSRASSLFSCPGSSSPGGLVGLGVVRVLHPVEQREAAHPVGLPRQRGRSAASKARLSTTAARLSRCSRRVP